MSGDGSEWGLFAYSMKCLHYIEYQTDDVKKTKNWICQVMGFGEVFLKEH